MTPSRHPGLYLIPLIMGVAVTLAGANAFGPLVARTGAPAIGALPAEATCNDAGCHSGNLLNQEGTLQILGVPPTYTPDQEYTLTVRLTSTANQVYFTRRWGFELTAVKLSDGAGAGSFSSPDLLIRTGDRSTGTRPYISHDAGTNLPGQPSPAEWSFTWIAPGQGAGTVGFYAAGNAANGDDTNLGDHIYTATGQAPEGLGTPTVPVTWGWLKSGERFGRSP